MVTIKAGTCKLTLLLPDYFEKATLTKIRKALSLLTVEPYENTETLEALDVFFKDWLVQLKELITSTEAIEQAYQKSVHAIESQIACFGSMATAEMKKQLIEEKRQHKIAVEHLKSRRSALAKAEKIKDHYENKVIKEIKNYVSE